MQRQSLVMSLGPKPSRGGLFILCALGTLAVPVACVEHGTVLGYLLRVPSQPSGSASPFLAACRSEPSPRVPVWFMRQAGRSLPEYRASRSSGSILQAVRDPALAAEITLQPVRRYGVDAAILFSDIMVPLAASGIEMDIVAGKGPIIQTPFRSERDLARLGTFHPETDAPYVAETVKILVSELSVPLIGFAGAPFTLASYLIEGGPSRSFALTKTLMRSDPKLWASLLDRLADMVLASLRSQVEAGAAAVQIFDSWVGTLSLRDYKTYVLAASHKVLTGLQDMGVPRIHFGIGTGELLGAMAEAGADVVGVDWRIPIDEARLRVPGRAVQGNLDPAVCLAPWPIVASEVRKVLADAKGLAGHIFNLGHGVLPETDPGILAEIVALVHEEGRADAEQDSFRTGP